VKVRLYGVDWVDGQPFGTAAKLSTSKKVFNLDVTVSVKDTDRYGRAVGNVTTADGASLCEALVRNGYAWWYHWYARDAKQLGELEIEARTKRVGLWAEGSLEPPWACRHPVPHGNAAAAPPAAAAPAAPPAPTARNSARPPQPAPVADPEC
jgi:micrococcal nuclease